MCGYMERYNRGGRKRYFQPNDVNFMVYLRFPLLILQNGFVECEQENCPAVDDCYMLEKKNGCCEKCKGNNANINKLL